MRQLRQLEEESLARRLRDFMQAEGVEATVNPAQAGGYSLWVHDDAQLEEAEALLALFEEDPDAPRVREALARIERRRLEQAVRVAHAAEQKARADFAENLAARTQRRAPVTLFWMIGAAGFALMAGFFSDGEPERVFTHLSATRESLMAGELHRLFTPAFVRSGLPNPLAFLGVFLGLFWMRSLGSPLEALIGTRRYLALTLLSAGLATLAEVALYGASVGGLSALCAAAFGHLWLRGRLDPGGFIRLRPEVSLWMTLWFSASVLGPEGARNAPRFLVGLLVGFGMAALSLRRRR